MKVLVMVLAVLAVGCGMKRTPVATGPRTDGFVPAPGLFAERDVQYIGSKPHCILRITQTELPDGLASYFEVPLQWCEGGR